MRMSLGRLKTTLKSWGESVKPIPNIITPSIGLMVQVSIQINEAGTNNETAPTANTIIPIHRAM